MLATAAMDDWKEKNLKTDCNERWENYFHESDGTLRMGRCGEATMNTGSEKRDLKNFREKTSVLGQARRCAIAFVWPDHLTFPQYRGT